MKIGAGIAGILLGMFSLTYVGIFGSMAGSAAGILGSIPFRGNNLGGWAQMVSMLSWAAPLATILGGIVTFSKPSLGGVILAGGALAHWYLLGLGTVGMLFVLPIGGTALLAFLSARSTLAVQPSDTVATNSATKSQDDSVSSPNVAGFDRARWNALLQYDKDIAT